MEILAVIFDVLRRSLVVDIDIRAAESDGTKIGPSSRVPNLKLRRPVNQIHR